ncbi:cupin domain-containing protein [Alicyclobacillus sp. ALC3]|uniref:cupin domain-containing protein n=1 Tax=Alicyclobacillus sp. ALC3 TaxID=2796143 RepID=UPI002379BB5F|nr:cupin domain-containing protein [Alicyclobacillus sp. ALC3]WDL97638.1 cupin domain-containing protein [Alicyclobacillus sp. ALC3]
MNEQNWPKELREFHDELESVHLGPLWASISSFNSVEPTPRAVPYLWKRDLIQHNLDKAKTLLEVGLGSAERRALFLINPGMQHLQPYGWGGTTQTLYAAIQVVNPGEVAPPHRHTSTALRFVMQGEGGYGTVDGERIPFEPGDYLITPDYCWHEHANEGTEPVVWMDCLDTPFIMALNVSFTEFYPKRRQPLTVPNDFGARRYQGGMVRPISDRGSKPVALGRYRWGLTKQALDGLSELDVDPFDGYAVEYINPTNGKDADGRIGAWMQKLPPGFQGRAHRHVHSQIFYVHQGQGYTVMNGVRFDWSEGDFFALPAWTWHEHVNTSSTEDAYLFSTNDLPMLEPFQFERQVDYDENEGHQTIEHIFQPTVP